MFVKFWWISSCPSFLTTCFDLSRSSSGLPSLYLRHSSFTNPSVCFTYVTVHSPTLLSLLLCHRLSLTSPGEPPWSFLCRWKQELVAISRLSKQQLCRGKTWGWSTKIETCSQQARTRWNSSKSDKHNGIYFI